MTSTTSLPSADRPCVSARRSHSYARVLVCVPAAIVLLVSALLSGCSGTVRAHLGSISVATASRGGQVTSVPQNTTAQLAVTATGSDPAPRVNWTVACAGSTVPPATPPATSAAAIAYACGTFTPPYTAADGQTTSTYNAPQYLPVGGSVTITAALASDPSITASTVLSIVPTPITISITTPPPAQLGVSGTALLAATVTNDTSAKGVSWTLSCGSTSNNCGSLQSNLPSPTQTASGGQLTYTAPATVPGGISVVTIKATSLADSNVSSTATVTIQPVSLTMTPTAATVPQGTTQNLTANVAFDVSNQGVDWSAPTCAASPCGSLSVQHTTSGAATVYTPSPTLAAGTTVSIAAHSTANPAATSTATLTIAPPPPVMVTVSPASASVQIASSLSITASTQYDASNLGVDWTVSCAASPCGTVTPHTSSGATATYTAPGGVPSGSSVTLTATATADNTRSASTTITVVPAISIAFTPALPTPIIAGSPATFTATVSNDIAAAGVDWTATCATAPCGSFSVAHTASGAATSFTPPATAPAGTITITATSTASVATPALRTASSVVTVTPVISVAFIPFAPSQVQTSDSTLLNPPPVNLTAVVVNDTTNAGIDWSVCSNVATCGQFQVVPALAATATTPAANAVYASTVHTVSGQPVAYVPPAQAGTVTLMAKAHNPSATSPAATAAASVNIVASPQGVAINGTVIAGTHPVNGATVTLYAAGTSGYGTASSNLAHVTTSASGAFTIPAGYSCPSQSSELYLLAQGGNAGSGANANLALMTALGPCAALNSASNLIVNEATTVGSVWALAPFMSNATHLGSSSSNATSGLANAFAAVNNLVSITSGQALATTPVGNATVPRAEINTLADILNTCTASAGGAVGDGSACAALFNGTNPGAVTSNAPTDTVQAALNIAHVPSYNTTPGSSSIFSLLPSTHVFAPVLTTDPNDWSIALSFTGGGLGTRSAASAMALDAAGNVWITNQRPSSVTELTSTGAPLSPPATGTATSLLGGFLGAGLSGPAAIAIDPLGNAWIGNNASLSVLPATTAATYNGALAGTSYTGGGLTGPLKGLAIDGTGNIWAVDTSSNGVLSWFAGSNATINGVPTSPGTALSPSAGYTQGLGSPSGGIQVDTAGTVWIMNAGSDSAAEYSSLNGSFLQSDFGYKQAVPMPVGSALGQGVGTGIAIDNAGNVFLSPGTQLVELFAGGSAANAGGLGTASAGIGDLYSPFLAVDGAGHLWTLITGGASNCPAQYSVAEFNTSGSQINVSAKGCGYVGAGIGAQDVAIAADGSGNLWVLSSGSVTEFVGLATPVVTPFSRGVQNKTLGKTP